MVTATLTDKPMNSLQLMFTWSSLNQACYVLCSCRWVLWWSMFEHGTYPNTWHLTIFWWSLFGTHFSGPVIKFGPFSVPKSLQFGWVKNRFFFFSATSRHGMDSSGHWRTLGVSRRSHELWKLLSQRSVSFGANAAVPPTTPSPSRNKTLRIVSLRPNGSRFEGRRMAVFGVFFGL